MNNSILILFLFVHAFYCITTSALECIKYGGDLDFQSSNQTSLNNSDSSYRGTSSIVKCSSGSSCCYTSWKGSHNGSVSWKSQGCFTGDCKSKESTCTSKNLGVQGFLFCNCASDLCNANFSWEPTTTTTVKPPVAQPVHKDDDVTWYLPYTIIFWLISLIIILTIMRRRKKYRNRMIINEEPLPIPTTPLIEELLPLEFEEVIGRGKFGAVWKATYRDEKVAVKIIPAHEKQAWLTEQEIMKFPFMIHDNILRLIAAEERGKSLLPEFWLITDYHPEGSLRDYLKSNVVTWEQFCSIGYTMAKGLTHLHKEIRGVRFKPAIAHRDFKSSNVLLRDDLSVCIADFDLALIFEPNKACGDTHGQVGTVRYMAPEVLEGCIHFSRDSFFRIDMYAFGLVLWELASRCSSIQDVVPEYKLPFEDEVGFHPSLEDMREIVVQKKRKPIIDEIWCRHPGFSELCSAINECLDHDSDARVSASAVMGRFSQYMRSSGSPSTSLLCDSIATNATKFVDSRFTNEVSMA